VQLARVVFILPPAEHLHPDFLRRLCGERRQFLGRIPLAHILLPTASQGRVSKEEAMTKSRSNAEEERETPNKCRELAGRKKSAKLVTRQESGDSDKLWCAEKGTNAKFWHSVRHPKNAPRQKRRRRPQAKRKNTQRHFSRWSTAKRPGLMKQYSSPPLAVFYL